MPHPRKRRRIFTEQTAASASISRKNLITRSKLYAGSALVMALFFIAIGSVLSASNNSPASFNQTELKTDSSTATEGSVNAEPPELPESAEENRANVKVRLHSSGSDNTAGNSSVQLQVNGQEIAVPENGVVERTLPDGGDSDGIHIQVQRNSAQSSESEERSRIEIDSETETEVEIRSDMD